MDLLGCIYHVRDNNGIEDMGEVGEGRGRGRNDMSRVPIYKILKK